MDAQGLLEEFLGSDHGQQAMTALTAQGHSEDEARTLLGHAVEAAHGHVESQAGMLGAHPGKSFFAAFAAGLVKGDGVWGAIKDGAEGTIGAKVTEAIASRAGVDGSTASTVAAAATPFIVNFLKGKLGG